MGLILDPGVRGQISELPAPVKRRVVAALRMLEADPREDLLDLKLLDTAHDFRVYRCRVQNYRIVFAPRAEDVYIWRVFHRRDGYGWLERL